MDQVAELTRAQTVISIAQRVLRHDVFGWGLQFGDVVVGTVPRAEGHDTVFEATVTLSEPWLGPIMLLSRGDAIWAFSAQELEEGTSKVRCVLSVSFRNEPDPAPI